MTPDLTDREETARFFADLARYTMPFGKYQGVPIDELPLEYLLWFAGKGGFPNGRLGELMAIVCTIKSEGDDTILRPLRALRREGAQQNPVTRRSTS